jgi:hypothetical protein
MFNEGLVEHDTGCSHTVEIENGSLKSKIYAHQPSIWPKSFATCWKLSRKLSSFATFVLFTVRMIVYCLSHLLNKEPSGLCFISGAKTTHL